MSAVAPKGACKHGIPLHDPVCDRCVEELRRHERDDQHSQVVHSLDLLDVPPGVTPVRD